MTEIRIDAENAGRRLDRVLAGYLRAADSGFLYRMLRKKNIVVNGKKADGALRVEAGDVITLFLADETVRKFRGTPADAPGKIQLYQQAYETVKGDRGEAPGVVFENDALLLVNKPAGVLSQGDRSQTASLNDWARGYLAAKQGSAVTDALTGFAPSVANRLDRNTSGLIVCVKTPAAARAFSALQKAHRLEKTYHTIVFGRMPETGTVYDTVKKNSGSNLVTVTARHQTPASGTDSPSLNWETLRYSSALDASLVRIRLYEGKTHQIRAQLASRGYPVAGDYKYGDRIRNDAWKQRFGVQAQLLHSKSLSFPEITDGVLRDLSARTFAANAAGVFEDVMLALYAGCHVAYLMQCADGTLYGGYTNDIAKRLETHNAGQGAKYTRGRTPVHPVYLRAFNTKEAAMKEEWRVKQLPCAEKLALVL